MNQEHEPRIAPHSKLLCIPETNKSSEISSQQQSHDDDIPTNIKEEGLPPRKLKPKRGSDFRRLEIDNKKNSYS